MTDDKMFELILRIKEGVGDEIFLDALTLLQVSAHPSPPIPPDGPVGNNRAEQVYPSQASEERGGEGRSHRWFLYACYLHNGQCYVGISTNPDRRFQEHIDGYASDVRRRFGIPIGYSVIQGYYDKVSAREVEKQVHKWLGIKSVPGV